MTKLIFGCGYLGKRVAARWQAAGHDVVVVTRSAERGEDFRRQGYLPIVADVTRRDSLSDLPVADTVLFAVGYDRTSSTKPIMDVYAGGMRNVLDSLPSETKSVIYISSTGVYGPAGGDWVDEETAPDPQREGGLASLAAENALSASEFGSRGVILRLAGIYGPGRVPFLNELRAGGPIQIPSTGYLNLIHVDDAASVVSAVDETVSSSDFADKLPRVFCVSDGHPVRRMDFYSEVARRIGMPSPQFVEADPNSSRAKRASGDRRVNNTRVLAELPIKLAYPDYRAGLAAILETENQ